MAKSGSMIDFKNLPNEAMDELYRFYEYLIHKYKRRKKKVHKKNILKNVEEMSWDMGKKLYKSRDELYER